MVKKKRFALFPFFTSLPPLPMLYHMLLLVFSLFCLSFPLFVHGYGEPTDGHPTYQERASHLVTNFVRVGMLFFTFFTLLLSYLPLLTSLPLYLLYLLSPSMDTQPTRRERVTLPPLSLRDFTFLLPYS